MSSANDGRVKRLDPKSDDVFKLCERFANKLTRESATRGENLVWFATENDHGYPQVWPVEFGR